MKKQTRERLERIGKNLSAMFRGYLFFKVNDRFFWLYSTARTYRVWLFTKGVAINFRGWSMFRLSWRGFYICTGTPRAREEYYAEL